VRRVAELKSLGIPEVTSVLRITRHPYEEPYHLNLVVRVETPRSAGELEIYINSDDLRVAADALRSFPRRPGDEFAWEIGSERPEDRWAYYFLLRVTQVRLTGQCSVRVRLNNNQQAPDQFLFDVSIPAEPMDLARLASLLSEFGKLRATELEWAVG